jgi:calcium-dependent protein kinase
MTAADLLASPWMQESTSSFALRLGPGDLANLQRYASTSTFRKAVSAVAAKKLGFADLSRLHELFVRLDCDKDGYLNLSEFSAAFTDSGLTDKDINALFKAVDLDASGKVEYTEFIAATFGHKQEDTERLVRETFNFIDKDGSGFITIHDLREFVENFDLGEYFEESQLKKLWEHLGASTSEVITIETFSDWLISERSIRLSSRHSSTHLK